MIREVDDDRIVTDGEVWRGSMKNISIILRLELGGGVNFYMNKLGDLPKQNKIYRKL